MEYYHLPWVHPGLVQVSPSRPTTAGRVPTVRGLLTSPIAQDTEGADGERAPARSRLDESDAVSARSIWLFPNVAVNILPNHLFIILGAADEPALDARDDLPAHAP